MQILYTHANTVPTLPIVARPSEKKVCVYGAVFDVALSSRHRAARLACCCRYLNCTNEYNTVLLTDIHLLFMVECDSFPATALAIYIHEHYISLAPGTVVWTGIIFRQWTINEHIARRLTAECYFNRVVLDILRLQVQCPSRCQNNDFTTEWMEFICFPDQQPHQNSIVWNTRLVLSHVSCISNTVVPPAPTVGKVPK